MELYISLFVVAVLFGFSAFSIKRRYANQLLSEQNKSSSLALSESQLKQKNMMVSGELEEKKKEAYQLQQECETLKEKLKDLLLKEEQARLNAESLSGKLSQELHQRISFQEQLSKTKELVSATSAQLQSTIEEQTEKLHQLQQHLHDEQVTRKKSEEIFSLRETEYRQKIAGLNATALSLKNELSSTAEGLNNEFSARQSIERDKTKTEQGLLEKKVQLESELSALKTEYEQLDDAFREESRVRLATEHALQESKEKLYTLIHQLEGKVAERDTIIVTLNSRLKDTESNIANLEDSVQRILSTVPVPVFVINNEGICSFVNSALQTTLGYSSEDLSGRHFSKLFPENDRLFYEQEWNTTENRTEQFNGETRFAAATGDLITAEIGLAEIQTDAGKKYIGFIFDKTTEHESSRHFSEAKRREEELKELKSRFIAMVTDQLRAALVTVATNAELLERFIFKWPDEKRYRAFFRINESLKQMLDLLRNVESSTSSVVRYKPDLNTVNLETLAQSVAKETANDLEVKHRFILSEQGDITSVKIDEAVVRTVLMHTFSNAYKFSPEDKEVKLHIERIDSTCTFTVEDHGIGIAPKEQPLLFQSFFRGSNVGNVHGTGLGLTIVQQYVQLAGGSVSVESQQNKGTKVKIILPISS